MKPRRHVPSKAALVARLPRWLRPKLDRSQTLDLSLVHTTNFDLIRTGQADEEVLWQWLGGMLTFSCMAALLGLGEPEMAQQRDLALAVLARYTRTGRAVFTGPELQLARDGIDIMDALARQVDRPTACRAADWSEGVINALLAQPPELRAALLTHQVAPQLAPA